MKPLIAILLVLIASPAFSGTVNLTVREQYGVARTNAPVTTGVPLPEINGITDVTKLRLLDGATPMDAQFKVLSRWGGKIADTTKNIQWVLVDTQVTQTANSNDTYTLEWGSSITTPTVTSPIIDSSTASAITVNTGAATFIINRDNFNIIDSVNIGGTEFIDATSHGAVIKDSFDALYYGENVVTSVEIEEDGPMRLVVVAKGFHGNTGATDNNFYGYTTRIHFYKGKSTVRVVHNLENRPDTARGALAFKDYSLNFELNIDSGTKDYMMYGATEETGTLGDSDYVYIYQDSDGEDNWNSAASITQNEIYNHTTFKGYKTFKNTTELEQSDQALGMLDISDSAKGVTTAVNQFWQRFPKKLMVDGDGTLTVGLLPDDFDFMFFVEDMSIINTEIFLNFHTGAYSSTVRDEIIDRLHPLLLVCPPSWYAANYAEAIPLAGIGYFKNGITPRLTEPPYTYITADTIVHPIINEPHSLYDQRDKGFYSAYMYGIRNAADRDGGSFEGPVEHFINFMQTGQPGASGDTWEYHNSNDIGQTIFKDYDLFWGGVDFAQHWMYSRATNLPEDFDHISAGLTDRTAVKAYYWQANYPQRGGRIGNDPIHTLETLTPTTVGSNGLAQPSFHWYAMDAQHITINHIEDYYRLTGDMQAIDYMHSMGEHLKAYLPNDMLNGSWDTGSGPTEIPAWFPLRGIAWPIVALINVYQVTDDDQYLNWATEAVKILDTAQDKERGFVYSVEGQSIPQFSKAVMALAALYKNTGDIKYIDTAEGYVNWLYYYIRDPETNYLSGYHVYEVDGLDMTDYHVFSQYYDSHHTQHGSTLTGFDGEGSDRRMFYMFAFLYKVTGFDGYYDIMQENYDYQNSNREYFGSYAALPWPQLFFAQRFQDEPPLIYRTDITPSVVNNGGGSYTLSWTVPSSTDSYRIKYSDKPIVPQIVYPDDSGIKENFWAVSNEVTSPPTPGAEGTTQEVTLTGLSTTGLNFAVRGYSGSAAPSVPGNTKYPWGGFGLGAGKSIKWNE